jgi:hypothetical protein
MFHYYFEFNVKKLLFVLFLTFPAFSQLAYLTGGADFRFSSSTGLDKFAERYNQTRSSIITKKMESPGTFSGWFVNFGGGFAGITFDLGYSRQTASMKAETDPLRTSGGGTGRDIDLILGNFMFGVGFAIATSRDMALIFPNFEANLLDLSYETRTNTTSKSGDVSTIANAGIGMKLMFSLGGTFGVTIHPSYNFTLLEPNFSSLYDGTATSYDVMSDETKGSFNGFHVRLGLSFLITD